jgi:hypothetical protein
MNEAALVDVLDAYVAQFDGEPEDWDDVVRRARRRPPRRRLALLIAVLVAALAGGPALGVLLLRDRGPQLPAGADRSQVVVALYPRSGKMFVELAPWKGHNGVCILFTGRSAGCWHRSKTGTMAINGASGQWGYTFDRRATGAAALLLSGKRVPLSFIRFRSLGVAVFYSTKEIRGDVQAAEVLGAGGTMLFPPALDVPAPSK